MTLHKFFLNLFLVFFSNLLSFQELEVYTNEDHDTLRSCGCPKKLWFLSRIQLSKHEKDFKIHFWKKDKNPVYKTSNTDA